MKGEKGKGNGKGQWEREWERGGERWGGRKWNAGKGEKSKGMGAEKGEGLMYPRRLRDVSAMCPDVSARCPQCVCNVSVTCPRCAREAIRCLLLFVVVLLFC